MDLASQAYPIAILIAGAFGFLSFLSPCVLPIVPAYLAFMSGVSVNQMREGENKAQLVRSAISFALGLSTVFLIMALTINQIASGFFKYQDLFTQFAGAIIVIFGLHSLGIIKIGFLQRELRMKANVQERSVMSAYILGLAFALGWSPCLGPALSAIFSMVASQENTVKGMSLMAVYGLGLGVPFVIAAIFMQKFLNYSSRLNKMLPAIEKIMGILLIVVGVMMISGAFTNLAFWLNTTFPILQNLG